MENKDADDPRWLILQRKLAEHRIEKVFTKFRLGGIQSILIKGWAAGLNYPRPWERYFSDIDVAVKPSDYKRAQELTQGFNWSVDLHKGLRHHDTLEWSDIYENSAMVAIGAEKIRLPREEDHLRILCVHWLTDGGAHKEKLLDVFYAVDRRSKNFDWNRCLEVVSRRRRRWIICTIGLAHKYFDLPIDDLPFRSEARRLPVWLTRALEKEWSSGVRLLPLDSCLGDKKMLWRQILKRIPPNPIEATVEMEGDFDRHPRILYQCGSIGIRILPSIKRIRETVLRKT